MATVAHLAAGALCGAVYARRTGSNPAVTLPLFATLALTPDLDFFAVPFDSDGTPLEHRAMTHSLTFAVVVGCALGAGLRSSPHRGLASLLAVVALGSHGILDAMTANAPGPQLWWPFTTASQSFPWQPIPGTRYWQQYFSPAGVPVLTVEAALCLPLFAATGWVLMQTVRIRGSRDATSHGAAGGDPDPHRAGGILDTTRFNLGLALRRPSDAEQQDDS